MSCDELRNSTIPELSRRYVSPSQRSPEHVQAQKVMQIILTIIIVVGFFLFLFAKYLLEPRGKIKFLRVRPTWAVIVNTLASLCPIWITGSGQNVHELDYMPCVAYALAFHLIVAGLALPLMVRMLTFYRGSFLTKLLREDRENANSARRSILSVDALSVTDSNVDDESDAPAISTLAYLKAFFFIKSNAVEVSPAYSTGSPRVDNRTTSTALTAYGSKAEIIPSKMKSRVNAEDVRVWRFFASRNGSLLLFAVYFFPYVLIAVATTAANPMVRAGCTGCVSTTGNSIILIVFAVFAVGGLLVATWVVRKFPDEFLVVWEVKNTATFGGITGIVFNLIDTIVPQGNGFDFSLMTEIGVTIYVCCVTYVPVFQVLRARAKDNEMIDALGGGQLERFRTTVLDLPQGSKMYKAFEDHLASEHSVESLKFFEDVNRWKFTFADLGANTVRARAKKIINLYVGDQSLFPCNLPSTIIEDLSLRISKTSEPIPSDFFDDALKEIVNLMARDSFMRFRNTKTYRKLVAEAQAGV